MKIKILVLNINDLGGIERVAVNLLNMFKSDTRFSTQIVSLNGTTCHPDYVILEGKNENNKLIKFIKEMDSDTIVLSLYDRFSIKLSILRKLIKYKQKFKLIACQHADYYAHRIHTRMLRFITYNWVDAIIALTLQDANLYKKHYNNVHTIPNALSFYPKNIPSFNSRNIDCAVAGRLVPIKQYNHFIYLLSHFTTERYNFKIYGEGMEYDNLKAQLNNANLNSESILVGKTDCLENELINTKFFFVTSLRESFSMVILEAMACGCVVISYDCPTGPRELIDNNVTGILIPLNKKEMLVEKYNWLRNNPELCQEISNRARKNSSLFLKKDILKKWISLFNEQ
ncbi:glycosyltransferase [Morganella morganii]|uniref:glycosyltransferase n=1 Tax=Morganella morganii TaxID=582 RepID=UPI003EBCD8F7